MPIGNAHDGAAAPSRCTMSAISTAMATATRAGTTAGIHLPATGAVSRAGGATLAAEEGLQRVITASRRPPESHQVRAAAVPAAMASAPPTTTAPFAGNIGESVRLQAS